MTEKVLLLQNSDGYSYYESPFTKKYTEEEDFTLENFMSFYNLAKIEYKYHQTSPMDDVEEISIYDKNGIVSDDDDVDNHHYDCMREELVELLDGYNTIHPVFNRRNYYDCHCDFTINYKDGVVSGKARGMDWVETIV